MRKADIEIQEKIDIVLDGVGGNNSWDAWLSYCANKNNKPILCFQHGGGNGLFNNPFREYMDYNPLFQRTNVQYGKNSCWGHEQNVQEKVVAGSLSLKKLHEDSKQVIPHKQVLYVPTHKQEENRFKDYNNNIGSDEIAVWDEAIIMWARRQNIRMIIKVHPMCKYEVKYYSLLVQSCGASNVEVTQHKSATKMMKESSVIVVNTVSMSIAQALSIDRAVVLIKPSDFLLPAECERWLRKSVLLLEKPDQLKDLSYDEVEGAFSNLYRKEIREKYLFNENDPRALIETLIKRKLGIEIAEC